MISSPSYYSYVWFKNTSHIAEHRNNFHCRIHFARKSSAKTLLLIQKYVYFGLALPQWTFTSFGCLMMLMWKMSGESQRNEELTSRIYFILCWQLCRVRVVSFVERLLRSNNISSSVFVYIYIIILLKSVGVRKLQVAILVRSSRDMSITVRNVWPYILSRVRVSVRPSIFCIREKHP